MVRECWLLAGIEKAARWAAVSLERCYRIKTGNGRARVPPRGCLAVIPGTSVVRSSLVGLAVRPIDATDSRARHEHCQAFTDEG